MPATRARSRQSNGKRARTNDDDTERIDKRHRASSEPTDTNHPNAIHVLRDRTRFSWQTKGKWREKTPKRNMMSLAQAASDLFEPGTSRQGAAANEVLASLDTSFDILSDPPPVSAKDVPLPETPVISQKELELQAEIEQLRNQLKQKDLVISRHEGTIELVQSSMHCPVCLDPLWKPFVVVPCGHIACEGCLINWFTSPPNGDPNLPRQRKRKTCPHCRGAVRSRPVEVYGLGSVVATLVGQPAPPLPVKADADPWAELFPASSVGPMRDDEDGGIFRCPDCLHELWDGECTHCGRLFSDGSGDSAYGSDDGSVSIYGDGIGSVFGGSFYGGSIYGSQASSDGSEYAAPAPGEYVPRPRIYDSYDEDEDEDDSFIDDSELPRPPPAAYFHHYVPSDSGEDGEEDVAYHSAGGDGYRSPIPAVIRILSSDSDQDGSLSDDEEEDDFLPPRGRRGRSAEGSPPALEEANEADDEEEDDDGSASNRVNPNATIDLVSDDDEEPPVRAAGRRAAATRWGWTSDEGEPPRGRSLSRRRAIRVRVESEDGSEYFSD